MCIVSADGAGRAEGVSEALHRGGLCAGQGPPSISPSRLHARIARMSKVLNRFDGSLAGKNVPGLAGSTRPEQMAQGHPPSAVGELPPDVLQYRFRTQRGVNLGSWFSLETWLTGSVFEGVQDAKSEYDLNAQLPASAVRQRLQHHWSTFITEGDWTYLVRHGVNTVRLPISYYHFVPDVAPHLMQGTEYEPFMHTYLGAWRFVQDAIRAAAHHGIGVLIDLHAAPGGQNTDGHVGLTTKQAGLWHGPRAKAHQQNTVAILVELVKAVGVYDNVVGVELLNEPKNGQHLTAFYDQALGPIRHSSDDLRVTSIPIYVSDAWSLDWYMEQFGGPVRANPLNPLVVDHHLYRSFTPQDHQILCAEHAVRARPGGRTFQYMASNTAKGHGNLIVGEWSAALHFTSWDKSHDKRAQQTDWAHSQLALMEATCAGQFFWTFKKEGNTDTGWCFYSAVEHGVMPSNLLAFAIGRDPSQVPAESVARQVGTSTVQAAVNTLPPEADASRFTAGFGQAWTDAVRWWYHPASHGQQPATIGYRKALLNVRLAQYQAKFGISPHDWAYDHGFLAALEAFDCFLRGL